MIPVRNYKIDAKEKRHMRRLYQEGCFQLEENHPSARQEAQKREACRRHRSGGGVSTATPVRAMANRFTALPRVLIRVPPLSRRRSLRTGRIGADCRPPLLTAESRRDPVRSARRVNAGGGVAAGIARRKGRRPRS